MGEVAVILGRLKLEQKLKRLPVAAKAHIRAAMEKQAEIIVNDAKSLVPVQTGRLRDSIGWTWGRAPKGSISIADVVAPAAELVLTIYAGSRVTGGGGAYYARFVEFGTVKTKAKPFFYVSWRANKRKTKNAIRAAVRKSARAAVAAGA